MFETLKKNIVVRRITLAVATTAAMLAPAVSAVEITLPEINWTQFGDFFAGMANMVPGLTTFVASLLGLLLVLMIIKFIPGVLGKILDMLEMKL